MEKHQLALRSVTRDTRAHSIEDTTHEVAGVADGVVVTELRAGVFLSNTPSVCGHSGLAKGREGID